MGNANTPSNSQSYSNLLILVPPQHSPFLWGNGVFFFLSFIPREINLVQWLLDFYHFWRDGANLLVRVKEKAKFFKPEGISSHNKLTFKYHYFIYFTLFLLYLSLLYLRITFGHIVLFLNKPTYSLIFPLSKHSFSLPSSRTENVYSLRQKKKKKKSFQLVCTMSQWGQHGWHHACHFRSRQTRHGDYSA